MDDVGVMAEALWKANFVPVDVPDRAADQQHHRMLAQAALAAIEASGRVVVPKEPTEAMLCAGDVALSCAGVDDSTTEDARTCYRAMIEEASNAGN